MKIKFSLLILSFIIFCQPLCADVYLLRDFFKRKNQNKQIHSEEYQKNRLSDILHFNPLFKEDISINNADGELKIGYLDYTYDEFLRALEYMNFKNAAKNSANSIIILGNRRYLVYNIGEFSKALCFEFDVPYRRNPPPLPYFIPDPGSGSIHNRIVHFPDRKTTYVSFTKISNARDAFANCKNQLISKNIKHIGNTYDSPTAGFFMNSSGTEIILMSFNDQYKTGFIYHTEKKK